MEKRLARQARRAGAPGRTVLPWGSPAAKGSPRPPPPGGAPRPRRGCNRWSAPFCRAPLVQQRLQFGQAAGEPFLLPAAQQRRALPRREARAQSGAQAGRVPAKNRPVDRLKHQRLVVHIDDFHQRPARERFAGKLPAAPGCRQRVVAIAHGKRQTLFFQRAGRFLDLRVLRAPSTRQPRMCPPPCIRSKIVQQFKRIAPRVQRLDERAARIVRQEHGVRRFQGRVFPDLYARGGCAPGSCPPWRG